MPGHCGLRCVVCRPFQPIIRMLMALLMSLTHLLNDMSQFMREKLRA
jgi:hypothetical protein